MSRDSNREQDPGDVRVVFRRLTDDDLPLLYRWLNEPGVVRWWEGDDVTWPAVVRDYGSASTDAAERWLALLEGRPIGWIQCYLAAHYVGEAEPEAWWGLGVDRTAAGIDYLIGEPTERGKGLGTRMIGGFVQDVVVLRHPDWTQVCASPVSANVASWRALEKSGFTFRGEFASEHGRCRLMVLERAAIERRSP
ncbi:MAG: GNAT family N-acetyltransferase [Actinobacteria bacterium]|nr:GNAT family N-acetyltransferase [Actinomycetota bacterium]